MSHEKVFYTLSMAFFVFLAPVLYPKMMAKRLTSQPGFAHHGRQELLGLV
jgi:hypothetical protein